MSQDISKLSKKELKKALIEEAQRLVADNEGNPISRDYFRNNSQFKDRWANCFNTFNEFMIAAKLPTISKPPTPELPIEQQVEIEKEKLKVKSENLRSKFNFVTKQLSETENQLNALLSMTERTPQIIDILPKRSTGTSESVAIMVGSDWHSEENVLPSDVGGVNIFNLEECEKRAVKFFQGGQRLWEITNRDTRVATIVLALLGDFITNTLHEDAQETNNLLPADAVIFAQDLIVSGIKFLLKETDAEELTIVCHSGNHGRMTKKQRNGRAEAGNSLERYMYHNLKRYFEEEPRIKFQIAEGYHSYLNLFGTYPIRFHHGHSIRYHGGVGGITIPVNKKINEWNKAPGHRNTRLDVFGHFHQYMDGGNFICNGSLVGYNAYAVSIGASPERPQQAFFLVNKRYNEKSISAPIFLTDGY
jgi:hypothetical protein